MLVQNSNGEMHKLSLGPVPVSMIYRDGKYLVKLPQTYLTTECFDRV